MADESENLVLTFLRRLDARMDRIEPELRDLKERMTSLELGMASVRRELVGQAEGDARLHARFDRLDDRVARIERRLDLTNGHSPS